MVQKYLDISTCHVSKETADWLDSIGHNSEYGDCPITMYMKGSYGWIVFVHDEFDEGTPGDLKAVIKYAKEKDCQRIMFYCDGEYINELPSFEW